MKEGVALRQLADVLPPAPPGWGWTIAMAVVAVLSAAGAWWWRWMRSRRMPHRNAAAREAQRRLSDLRIAWQARAIGDREAAYRLATVLRLGLGLPQLTPQLRPAAVTDARGWDQTLSELHAVRYRRAVGSVLSAQCFDHAEQWLAAAQREAR